MPASAFRALIVSAALAIVCALSGSAAAQTSSTVAGTIWDKTTDLAIARNIRIGGSREVQFRLDIFNAFNSVVINARNTTIQYNNPSAATTITNNQYNVDGSLNTARLTPATAGAGAATAAQAMRSMQMQIRFRF